MLLLLLLSHKQYPVLLPLLVPDTLRKLKDIHKTKKDCSLCGKKNMDLKAVISYLVKR